MDLYRTEHGCSGSVWNTARLLAHTLGGCRQSRNAKYPGQCPDLGRALCPCPAACPKSAWSSSPAEQKTSIL